MLRAKPAASLGAEKPAEANPAAKPAERPPVETVTPSTGKNLCLVDGSGYISRAYQALPPLTRPDGTPVGAVLGFTNMLLKLMASHDCDYLPVIFDAGRKTFRNEIYTNYKANRDEPPPEPRPQLGPVREAARACNVPG